MTAPTPEEIERAARRQEIAERWNARYYEARLWALACFGPGWEPSHKHMLVTHEEAMASREKGTPCTAAHTIYTVKRSDGERRHFMVVGGTPVACEEYKKAWAELMLTPHPTRRLKNFKGEEFAPHLYELHFAPFELYEPQSAEALAKGRVAREAGKARREDEKFKRDNPLFADLPKETP